MTLVLHCIESFIITPSSSQHDLSNDERDIKQQIIIIISRFCNDTPDIDFAEYDTVMLRI